MSKPASTYRVDTLVVGAGPAGLAAATAAASCGQKVIVLDDNPFAGGQIWRSWKSAEKTGGKRGAAMRAFERSDAESRQGRRVIDAVSGNMLRAVAEQNGGEAEVYAWQYLILATGARELFLPFPGWTSPRVFGAGGLQALEKSGYPVSGKRVLVAGTGPLLLAAAAHLKEAGAEIVSVIEQAPLRQLLSFVSSLWSRPSKLFPAVYYGAALADVPYKTACWPVVAREQDESLTVTLSDSTNTWKERCHYLACGFHLVPNTELAALLGCLIREGRVVVNDQMKTSVENIYCVGEAAGVAGLDAALIEGRIAGLMAAGEAARASRLRRRRDSERRFGERLSDAFRLRPELRTLCSPDTVVCRCEDVAYGQLQGRASWTEAKLQTRCGMGACQGRVCGGALEAIFGWKVDSVRPPIFPAPLESLRTTVAQAEETAAP